MADKLSNTLSDHIDSLFHIQEVDFQTSGAIADLVARLIQIMSDDGIYIFAGSWTQHASGYSAMCSKSDYSSTASSWFGIIKDHAGNVWSFTQRTSGTTNIKQIATA